MIALCKSFQDVQVLQDPGKSKAPGARPGLIRPGHVRVCMVTSMALRSSTFPPDYHRGVRALHCGAGSGLAEGLDSYL